MEVYLKVIGEAVFFFPLIALLFTLPYVLYNYRKYGSVFSVRILIMYSFVLYMLCVFFGHSAASLHRGGGSYDRAADAADTISFYL